MWVSDSSSSKTWVRNHGKSLCNNNVFTLLKFSLSTPFDVRGKVALDGEIILTDPSKLGGINFSNDGLKMFVTDWGDRGVY